MNRTRTSRRARCLLKSSPKPIIELLELRQLLAAGDFDIAFSDGGRLTGQGGIQDAQVTADGKIVTAGFSDSLPVIRRFNADGSPDTSFGGGTGRVSSPIFAYTVEPLPSGHVLLGGSLGNFTFAVARLNPDGTLDSSFGGGDGIATVRFKPADVNEGENAYVDNLAIDSEGRIIASGDATDFSTADPSSEFRTRSNVLARFTSAGDLDTSFSSDGTHSIGSSSRGSGISGLDIDAQDRPVFIQYYHEHGPTSAYLYRLTEDGQADTSFVGDGVAELGLDYGNTGELAIQSDGDIVFLLDLAGSLGPALFIYNPDGTHDNVLHDMFGHHDDGQLLPVVDSAYVVDILPDDRIVVAGASTRLTGAEESGMSGQNHVIVNRFTAAGEPDTTFRGGEPRILDFSFYDIPSAIGYDAATDGIVIAGNAETWIDEPPLDDWFITRLQNEGGSEQRSYGATNWKVGERIEAENFDVGGQGVAFSDTTAANEGQSYRNTGVDIYRTNSNNSNFNVVGLTRPGEWLEFTVDVAEAGTYNLQTRYATPASQANYSYMVNGVGVTGTRNFSRTGSYETYATATTDTFNLAAGTHVIRLNIGATNAIGTAANLDWIQLNKVSTTPPTQTPFKGTPFVPNQVIEAEDFDNGGQNGSFLDTTSANEGGAYRPSTAVDLYAVAGASNAHVVGLTRPSEWLEYTINVAEAGTYSFDTRYATPATTAAYQYQIDGANATGVLNFNRTGSYENYATARTPTFNLSAGTHVVRLFIGNTNAVGTAANIDWLRLNRHTSTPVTQTPFHGTPFAVNTTIQAEDYDRGGQGVAYNDVDSANLGGRDRTSEGVDIETTGDTGGGFNVSHTRAGEWIEYTISVPTTGAYDIQTRLAAVQTGTMHYEVDGQTRATVNITPTGGFQSYTTLTHSLGTLSAGTRVLRVPFDSTSGTSGVANVNWLKIVPASTQQDTQAPSAVPEFQVIESENLGSIGYRINWSAATDNVGVAGYRLSYTHRADFDEDGDHEERLEGQTFGPDARSTSFAISNTGSLSGFAILAFDPAGNEGPPVNTQNSPSVPRGLTGTYFNNSDFTSPAFTRIDPTINFDWGAGSPDSRIAPDTFSVRWTGQIIINEPANYTFFTSADDRARLFVDGVQVVNYIPGNTSNSGSIGLEPGRYAITYEYVENTGNARAKLEWSHPGMARQVVPNSALLSS